MPRCVAAPQSWYDEYELLARVIMGEATGEPFTGMVAVGAVIINRTKDPAFPPTLAGVIYDPDAFESVTNGLMWSSQPTDEMYRAAELALNGYDPTYGCTFFWNPYKPVSPWIWSRPVVTQIGNHVFAY
ncbi:MAG TPA: spore cortex-lytic protein [Firmicutes bacterium]|nr:spore cortex-lytic protein [Candidatus Fermentithermobacillaceae bacterium]